MRKHIFTIMAIAAALCACNKEQNNVPEVPVDNPQEPIVFTAFMESTPGSKVTLDGMTPSWEVGDQIRVNGAYLYAAQNSGTSDVKFWAVGQDVSDTKCEAIFPTSYMIGVGWGTIVWQLYFPQEEEYEWVDGRFSMPMHAIAYDQQEPELHFKNLCGVLRITVPDHQFQQVQAIRVYNTNKPMTGTFKVGEDGGMELTESFPSPLPEGVGAHTIIFTEPVPVLEESKVFYIPVPPQAYNYIRIDIAESSERSETGTLTFPHQLRTKGAVTIERNKIYSVTFNHPSATEYITITEEGLAPGDFE